MHIQPTMAASVAAGNVSQATSRDRTAGGTGEAASLSLPAGVERVAASGASDADRDAQGGGQGLDARSEHPAEPETSESALGTRSDLAVSSPEPPSQLDIVG